jgi:AraC-like DNA-binding protein
VSAPDRLRAELRIEERSTCSSRQTSPLTKIGFAVGYEDPSFFRRLFKRRTGVTPARYRRVFQPVHRGLGGQERRTIARARSS